MSHKVLALFDVDGTLTEHRQVGNDVLLKGGHHAGDETVPHPPELIR